MIPDIIRDIYHRLEDVFYSLLDFLDAHDIPVYRIHDFLDEHGIPPFPAFLISLILVGFLLFQPLLPSSNLVSLDLYVKDESGSFIDAYVILYKDGKVVDEGYATDGYVSFGPLEPGTYEVEVSAEGYKRTTLTVTLSESGSKEVTLRRSEEEKGKIWGILKIVLTDMTGREISGRVILLYEGETKSVDINGVAEVDVPLNVKIEYVATAPGYLSKRGSVVLDDTEKTLHIVLSPTGTVSFSSPERATVSIKVLKNGEPQQGMEVKLMSSDNSYTDSTNGSGVATFSIIPGEYNVFVEDISLPVKIDKSTELVVDVTSGVAGERVQIIKDGQPLKNVIVRVDGHVVTTDDEGWAIVPINADAKKVEEVSLKKYRLYVKVKYKDKYLNSFKVKVLSNKGTWEKETHSGLAFFILPGDKYIVKVWAYGEELTKQVELTKDVKLELTVEHPKALVTFTGTKGIIKIAGKSCTFSAVNTKCSFELEPGKYEYTYEVDGFYPYKDIVDLNVFSEETIDLTKVELIPDTFLPPGSEPKLVSVEAICKGKNIGVLCNGGTLRLRLHVPKEKVEIRIESSNPNVTFSNNSFVGIPNTPEISLLANVTVKVDSVSTSFPVKIIINGKEMVKTFAVGRDPIIIGPVFVFGLKNTEYAPGGRFEKDILFAGEGEILITPPGTKVNVSGPTMHTLSLKVEYPTTTTLTSYVGGIKAGEWSFNTIPQPKEEKPADIELVSWWFEGEKGKTGRLLLPGENLRLVFAIPDAVTAVSVNVEPEKEYYPRPERINVGKVVNNRVEVNVNFKQFLLSLDSFVLNIEVNAVSNGTWKIKRFTIKPACYPWNPFHVFNDGKIFYAMVLDGSAFPEKVRLGTYKVKLVAFSPAGSPGEVELKIGDRTLSVPLSDHPKEEETSIELLKDIEYNIIWKAKDFETLLENNIIEVNNSVNLTVCTNYKDVAVNNIDITVTGLDNEGEKITVTGSTGSNGCYTFALKPGEYNVTAEDSKGIYLTTTKTNIVLRRDKEVTLELVPENVALAVEPLYVECNVGDEILRLPFVYGGCKELNVAFRVTLRPEDTDVILAIKGYGVLSGETNVEITGKGGSAVEVKVPLTLGFNPKYSFDEAAIEFFLISKRGELTQVYVTTFEYVPELITKRYLIECDNGVGGYLYAEGPFDLSAVAGEKATVVVKIMSCGKEWKGYVSLYTTKPNKEYLSLTTPFIGDEVRLEVPRTTDSVYLRIYDERGVQLIFRTYPIVFVGKNDILGKVTVMRGHNEVPIYENEDVNILVTPGVADDLKDMVGDLCKVRIKGVEGIVDGESLLKSFEWKGDHWELQIHVNSLKNIEVGHIILDAKCSGGINLHLNKDALPVYSSRLAGNIDVPSSLRLFVESGKTAIYKIEIKNNTLWNVELEDYWGCTSDGYEISIEKKEIGPDEKKDFTLAVIQYSSASDSNAYNCTLYTNWKLSKEGKIRYVLKQTNIDIYVNKIGIKDISTKEITVTRGLMFDAESNVVLDLPNNISYRDLKELITFEISSADDLDVTDLTADFMDDKIILRYKVRYKGDEVGYVSRKLNLTMHLGDSITDNTELILPLRVLSFDHPLRVVISDNDLNTLFVVFGDEKEKEIDVNLLNSADISLLLQTHYMGDGIEMDCGNRNTILLNKNEKVQCTLRVKKIGGSLGRSIVFTIPVKGIDDRPLVVVIYDLNTYVEKKISIDRIGDVLRITNNGELPLCVNGKGPLLMGEDTTLEAKERLTVTYSVPTGYFTSLEETKNLKCG